MYHPHLPSEPLPHYAGAPEWPALTAQAVAAAVAPVAYDSAPYVSGAMPTFADQVALRFMGGPSPNHHNHPGFAPVSLEHGMRAPLSTYYHPGLSPGMQLSYLLAFPQLLTGYPLDGNVTHEDLHLVQP
jgi:hypothetical protein